MCEFCDELKNWKTLERFDQRARYIYQCKLIRKTMVETRAAGSIEGTPHNVNYCPMCGRKVTED
jgi:hypothetical protein